MSSSSEPAPGGKEPRPGLLFSFGNLLRGDDGIGPRIIEAFAQQGGPLPFLAHDLGNDGLKFLALLDGFRGRALIIDCGRFDGAPGDSRLFSPREILERGQPAGLSTHEGRVLPLVQTALELYPAGLELGIFAVRGSRFEQGSRLSPVLETRLPDYTAEIIAYFTG